MIAKDYWKRIKSIVSGSITVLRITLLMTVILGLISCSEHNNPTIPDFSTNDWQTSYDAIMQVDVAGRNSSVILRTKQDPGYISLKLNEELAAAGASTYSDEESVWISYFDIAYVSAGSTVSFELRYNGKTIDGVLSIPANIEGVFPFFGDDNYSFEWTTPYSPQLYLIDLEYYHLNELHTIREQIDGSALAHTIQSHLWGGGLVYPSRLTLSAINYTRIGSGFFAYTQTSVIHSFR